MRKKRASKTPREKGERLAEKRLREHEDDLFGYWWPFDDSFRKLATLCACLPPCTILLQMDKRNTLPVELLWQLAGVFSIGCLVMLTLCVVSDYFSWKRRRRFLLNKVRNGEAANLNKGNPFKAVSMSLEDWIAADKKLRATLARFEEASLLDAEASLGAKGPVALGELDGSKTAGPRTERPRLGARRI